MTGQIFISWVNFFQKFAQTLYYVIFYFFWAKNRKLIISGHIFQWRIQDFPEVGAPTLRGEPTYDFVKISQKTA